MDIKDFKSGSKREGSSFSYFSPEKINHPFVWADDTINELLEKASLRLGELNSFSRFVPDIDMFIMMHIVKEAVVSSRIEGTQTNITEAIVARDDLDPEKREDWIEVNNYVNAMNYAIEELKQIPLSNRLIRNTHKILLTSARGQNKNPGEFRTSQNWIGGATLKDAIFIPPAHHEVPALLTDLELFLQNSSLRIPHLVRIAIAHYQFETIHPFLDGNGRIGRLLITLYLVSNGILEKPLLYLSDFFERNRLLYYDNLTLVREKNDLAQWLKFFLTGVVQTAESSISTLKKITDLKDRIEKTMILTIGKRSKAALSFFHFLFRKPIIRSKEVPEITGLSPKAALALIDEFVNQGILVETTGHNRNRVFMFKEYVELF